MHAAQHAVMAASAILLLVSSLPAGSQTSLEDIEAELGRRSGEFERVDKLLAEADPNRRVAAIEALLKSGNPVFVKRAKEVGLFSSDAEMQEAALKAVFDAGGPFRVIVDLTGADEEQSRARRWSSSVGSVSSDGKKGFYPFRLLPYDEKEKCWKFQGYNACALFLTGTSVSLDWGTVTGNLALDGEGALSGSFLVKGAGVATAARIPLID